MKLKILTTILLVMITASCYAVSTFNNSASAVTITFNAAGNNTNYGINVPSNASVSYSKLNITGEPSTVRYFLNYSLLDPTVEYRGIDCINATYCKAVGLPLVRSVAYRVSTFNGTSWNNTIGGAAHQFAAVDLLNETYGFAATTQRALFFFNGSDWALNQSSTGILFYDIELKNRTLGFAVGRNGGLMKWDGSEWRNESSVTSEYIYSITFYDNHGTNDSSIICDARGQIYIWDASTRTWSFETDIGDNPLYGMSSYGRIVFGVGYRGALYKRSELGVWAQITSPTTQNLYGVHATSEESFTAVGSNNTIIRYDRDTATLVPSILDTNQCLEDIYMINDSYGFAVGWGEILEYRYAGPLFPAVRLNNNSIWNYTSEYIDSTLIENFIDDVSDYCVPDAANCTVTINISSETPGKIKLDLLNVTYATQLLKDAPSLSFNTSAGVDVAANAQSTDDTIYVYNGTTLLAAVPTTFASQPNYSGWTGESGVNATDNRAYVRTDPLPSGAMNTSQKTVYLRWANTSFSKVCVINSAVSAETLRGILTESQCASAGGTVVSPSVVSVNGINYFELTGLSSSGGVQIESSGNNPPVLTNPSASPITGDQYQVYWFEINVTDPDNDAMSFVNVFINGNSFAMSESDPADATTSDGKKYYYSGNLGAGNYNHYFQANDGTDTVITGTYYAPNVSSIDEIFISATDYSPVMFLIIIILGLVFILAITSKRV